MGMDSTAGRSLFTCLYMLREDQTLYSAARRATNTIERLMQQMDVVADSCGQQPQSFQNQNNMSASEPVESVDWQHQGEFRLGQSISVVSTSSWRGGTDLEGLASLACSVLNADLAGQSFDIDAMVQSFGFDETFVEDFCSDSRGIV